MRKKLSRIIAIGLAGCLTLGATTVQGLRPNVQSQRVLGCHPALDFGPWTLDASYLEEQALSLASTQAHTAGMTVSNAATSASVRHRTASVLERMVQDVQRIDPQALDPAAYRTMERATRWIELLEGKFVFEEIVQAIRDWSAISHDTTSAYAKIGIQQLLSSLLKNTTTAKQRDRLSELLRDSNPTMQDVVVDVILSHDITQILEDFLYILENRDFFNVSRTWRALGFLKSRADRKALPVLQAIAQEGAAGGNALIDYTAVQKLIQEITSRNPDETRLLTAGEPEIPAETDRYRIERLNAEPLDNLPPAAAPGDANEGPRVGQDDRSRQDRGKRSGESDPSDSSEESLEAEFRRAGAGDAWAIWKITVRPALMQILSITEAEADAIVAWPVIQAPLNPGAIVWAVLEVYNYPVYRPLPRSAAFLQEHLMPAILKDPEKYWVPFLNEFTHSMHLLLARELGELGLSEMALDALGVVAQALPNFFTAESIRETIPLWRAFQEATHPESERAFVGLSVLASASVNNGQRDTRFFEHPSILTTLLNIATHYRMHLWDALQDLDLDNEHSPSLPTRLEDFAATAGRFTGKALNAFSYGNPPPRAVDPVPYFLRGLGILPAHQAHWKTLGTQWVTFTPTETNAIFADRLPILLKQIDPWFFNDAFEPENIQIRVLLEEGRPVLFEFNGYHPNLRYPVRLLLVPHSRAAEEENTGLSVTAPACDYTFRMALADRLYGYSFAGVDGPEEDILSMVASLQNRHQAVSARALVLGGFFTNLALATASDPSANQQGSTVVTARTAETVLAAEDRLLFENWNYQRDTLSPDQTVNVKILRPGRLFEPLLDDADIGYFDQIYYYPKTDRASSAADLDAFLREAADHLAAGGLVGLAWNNSEEAERLILQHGWTIQEEWVFRANDPGKVRGYVLRKGSDFSPKEDRLAGMGWAWRFTGPVLPQAPPPDPVPTRTPDDTLVPAGARDRAKGARSPRTAA